MNQTVTAFKNSFQEASCSMDKVRFVRNVHLAPSVVFLDAISGSGKSILNSVLASFDKGEGDYLDSTFEYLCILDAFRKIDTDAAIAMLRLRADVLIYNSMISREVNLRPFDDTGFLNKPFKFRTLQRLFCKDGHAVEERIKKYKPFLHINTHQLFLGAPLAFRAFGKRLRIIEVVRHPVFLFKHWMAYVNRYGTDSCDLTLWVDGNNGQVVPWFAHGWGRRYLDCNSADKAIYSIASLTQTIFEIYDKLSADEKKQVIFIPFEKFVTNPWPFLTELEAFLNAHVTSQTKTVLKRQKCPRQILTDGRGHAGHGWKKPAKNTTDAREFVEIMNIIQTQASQEAQLLLQQLSKSYEERFGRILKM